MTEPAADGSGAARSTPSRSPRAWRRRESALLIALAIAGAVIEYPLALAIKSLNRSEIGRALPFLGVAFTIYGGYSSWGPSIPMSETFVALMGAAAAMIAGVLKRYPWISFVGLAVIVYVALKMIYLGSMDVAGAAGAFHGP